MSRLAQISKMENESDGNTSFLRAARNGQLDRVLEHLKSNIDINTSNANGLNALHLASKDGHVEIVDELLKRGAVVDAATKKGNTALHIASLAGQEEVVKLLVQHGASVNVQSQNGFTPLYMAAQENHDNVVKYLLSNGANQSLSTEDGFTPLAVAMQQGHDKVVAVLLENDTRGKVRLPALHIAAKKDDVKAAKLLLENEHNPDVTSKSGFTPLHIASHYGNQSIANLLVQKGADVNYSAKHNITPLHVAAKWGKTNMVTVLLEQGANIESKTRDGLTPLHCAARSGHEQVVDMLVEKGAPISSKTKNGLAPLHMAAQGDHVDSARILLFHRAPVDEVTVDYLTALHVAAHCGHVKVAKLLLERQADADARALNGFTPLHIACKKNRIKVVELLLKHKANISATTESGLTPLHVASFMGCMNIVIYLLQHEAHPDVPTVRGETPLHLAARANQTDIIRILLRNGAQVDARAREQQTPLHIASRLGNVDIVMLLLQHGAKVDNATKDMYTALHIAAKEGQDEVAAVLIDNGASLNATTKKGFTPLHLAAKYGHLKVAKLLLQKEAPVDAQGKNGVTPLHVASHYDHQNVALLLLEKGASPYATAKNGHTPLHIAAKKNQMDIANTLLEYGAKPNAESKAGFTPLHLSAQEGHSDMSALLIEHKADTNHCSKNGLTPLHLCAQEDKVPVAEVLVKNGAGVDAATKNGYTPLHIACHYGQINMVRFLLSHGADVKATTSLGYTPLHQAAQQGHTNIVNALLESQAQPDAVTNSGQTPLHIAQKLGYITVIDTLKVVTQPGSPAPAATEEKYRVVAPEAMHETFMSDSEEEGEDTVLGDQTYRYLTADEMKSLGDDSLPIDVTRDERIDSNKMQMSTELPPQHIEDNISPEHVQQNYVEYIKRYTPDNIDIDRHPINIGFLVSFLVDARGGAMRGCRHSGVRVIVPPRCASSPTRITCRYVRPQRTPHPPPLMEGEALASRVLELGPVGAKFLGPVIIEVPHFAALRGKEREIVILRSDNGESWKEHTVEASEEVLNDVLHDSFDADDLSQMEDVASGRITRVVTQDFPQYFAVVSRIRQEVHAIGPEGGMVSSTVVPQVQAVFPQGALTKKIKVGLQAQPIDPELTAKLLGHGVAVSPVVTVEPRRRKFHKAITLSMPAPRAHSQGMINQYSGAAPTLRLLCSITGGTTRAQWEDVTGSTPLSFVNDCVSFTTTVSARFWLMDCRNVGDATKMATELYKEAIHVPFMAKFVVFAKRVDPLEARLRVFCMTDDKEDKTLEHQEHFTEVAKSRDVEVLEGKAQYIEFAGNLVPITKSGEQLQFSFRAFKENRLPFSVRVKDQHAEAVSRCLFMREAKVQKGEPPQQPICILNIVLPDDIVADTISLNDTDSIKRQMFSNEIDYYRPDPRLSDMSNLLGEDWVPLATQLGLTTSEINVIKSEYPDSVAKQAQSMLRMWLSQSGNKAQANTLESALRRIGREDIIPQCLNVDYAGHGINRIKQEELGKQRLIQKIGREPYDNDAAKGKEFDKYSAEEKAVETSDEEDFNKTVPERRHQIEERLSVDRSVPASSQRVEIVQEITSIKQQSLVENKIAVVEQKAKEVVDTKTTPPPSTTPSAPVAKTNDSESARRDSILLEEVTQRFETSKTTPVTKILSSEDPNSPKFSKTPPPSPADFISREQAAAAQEWDVSKKSASPKETSPITKDAEQQGLPTTTERFVDSNEAKQPLTAISVIDDNLAIDLATVLDQTNAFIQSESQAEPHHALAASYSTKEEPVISLSDKKLDDDKNNMNEKKKAKKGFFGTIKTFVEKSFESDSESEKSPRKSKKPKKDKKKKSKNDKSDVGLPPKKPKLPTPPLEPHDLDNIPYVESSPTDEAPHYKPPEVPHLEETDLVTDVDADTVTTTVTTHKSVVVIPVEIEEPSETIEQKTQKSKREKSPKRVPKKTKTVEMQEVTKTIEPWVIETEEFSIVIDPTNKESPKKSKETFTINIDETIGQIEREILEKSPILTAEKIVKPVVCLDETPIRPPRLRDHVYEDIEEPVRSIPPDHLVETIEISNIAQTTTDLIENEQKFHAWEDSPFKKVTTAEEIIEKHDQEVLKEKPKSKEDKGGFFGLFKKSKKDEESSPSKKPVLSESVIKDMEYSSQFLNDEVENYHDVRPVITKPIKVEEIVKEEIEEIETKHTGIFKIFKKTKKEDESPEKKIFSPTKQGQKKESEGVKAPLPESVLKDMTEADEFLKVEIDNYHDVKPTVKKLVEDEINKSPVEEKTEGGFFGLFKKSKKDEEIKSPPTESKQVHIAPAAEPVVVQETIETEEKPVKIRSRESSAEPGGLFGLFKKSKRDSKEGEIKPILSDAVLKDIDDTNNFLNDEVNYFQDVKILPPIRATVEVSQESHLPDESPKPSPKDKKSKQIKSRDSSEERSGFFGIFKKSRKESEDVTSPKHVVLSESVVQDIHDSNKFLIDEVTNYHDVEPIVENVLKPADTEVEEFLIVETETAVDKVPVKEPTKVEKTGELKTKKIKSRESSEDRSGFLGLFKKSKKDAKDEEPTSPKRVTLSENVVKDINESNKFLLDEVTKFHDVRPIVEKIEDVKVLSAESKSPKKEEKSKEAKKIKSREGSEERTGILGLFKKAKKDTKDEDVPSPKHVVLSETVLKDINDSDKFLSDELNIYHDVRPEGDVKVEDVLAVETDTTVAQSPSKDEKQKHSKSKENKSRESSEERTGFLGLFKKPKKAVEDEETVSSKAISLPENVLKDIENSNKFLHDEVTHYHDVKPIIEKVSVEKPSEEARVIQKETIIVQLPPVPDGKHKEKKPKEEKTKEPKPKKIKSRESSEDRSGFLGLLKKPKKEDEDEEVISPKIIPLSESVLKNIDDSNKFLHDEVSNYHDVKPIIEKVSVDKPTEEERIVQKEMIIVQLPPEPHDKPKEKKPKDEKTKEPKPKKIKSRESSEDRSGFLGLFKKPKKEGEDEAVITPKSSPLSESVLKNIDDSNKFLLDEVSYYHDVKPVIEKVSAEKPTGEARIVQKETIIVQLPSVPDDKHKEKKPKEEKSKEPKPKKIKSRESSEDRSGFLGLFKKQKKDAKEMDIVSPKHLPLSESVQKDIDDSNTFLQDEVNNYNDVKPIIEKLVDDAVPVTEAAFSIKVKDDKHKAEKDESKPRKVKSRESSEDRSGFLGLFKKPKKDTKEEKIISPKHISLSESVQKDIDDSNTFLQDEVNNYHDVKPIVEKQVEEAVTFTEAVTITSSPVEGKDEHREEKVKESKPKNAKSSEPSEDRIGFLGLFKKPKKDEKQEGVISPKHIALTGTVLKDIDGSRNFLLDEVHHYHDVKYVPEKVEDILVVTKTEVAKVASPILTQEIVDTIDIEIREEKPQTKSKKVKSRESSEDRTGFFSMFKKPKKEEEVLTSKHSVSDAVLKDMDDTHQFLTDEVTYYHDVKAIPQEDTRTVVEEVTFVTSSTPVLSQTEKVESPKEEKHKGGKPKKSKKIKSRESSEDRSGFFGLFKKSKKDSVEDERTTVLSEEIKKDIDDTSKFLKDEVTNFEDVKPTISPVAEERIITEVVESKHETVPKSKSRETSEERTGFFGLFKKSHKESGGDDIPIAEPSLSEAVLQDMIQTRQFLMDEVEKYEDVKPERFSHVEVEIAKKDKKPRPKSREVSEERSGFLGLFKSKPKQDDEPTLSETVVQEMEDSQQFLSDEVQNYHDVKPTITEKIEDAEPLIIEKVEKVAEEKYVDEPSKSESAGFFGLFKKSKKEVEGKPQFSEVVAKDMVDTNQFLMDEVEKYHDVKPLEEATVIAAGTTEEISPVQVSRESSAEPGGFLSRFKRTKERSEGSQQPVFSEQLLQDMNDTTQFLTSEVVDYHDVRPIVSEVVTEPLPEATEASQIQESTGFFGLFKKSKKDEEKVKSPEKLKKMKSEDKTAVKFPEKVKKGKETASIDPQSAGKIKEKQPLSEIVIKDMSETTTFLTDEVEKYHDVRSGSTETSNFEPSIREEQSLKLEAPKKQEGKGGFLSKFKKTKKDVDLLHQLSQEVVKDMDDSKLFLQTEVDNYEHSEFITEPKLEVLEKTAEQVEKAIEVLDVESKSVMFETDLPEVLGDSVTETKTAAKDLLEQIDGSTEPISTKVEKKEKHAKEKKSGIFNIFGKKSKSQDASLIEEGGNRKSDDEDTSPKKKHEKRRKSGSPFKFFDKMRKSEEREEPEEVVVTETTREIEETMTCEVTEPTGDLELSQEVLESLEKKIEELKSNFSTDVSRQIEDCGDFLFNEKDNYDSSKPEVVTDIDVVAVKSSDGITKKIEAAVIAVDDILHSATKAVVSDANTVDDKTKQTVDDFKLKSDAEVKTVDQIIAQKADEIIDQSKQKLDDVKTEVSTTFGKLGGQADGITKDVAEKTKDKIEDIKEESTEVATKLSKKAKKKAEKAKKESSGFFSKIGGMFSGAAKDAKDELEDKKEQVTSKANEVEKAAGKTVDEISIKEQEISSRLDEKATKTVESLEKVSKATFEMAKTETEKAKESVEQAAQSSIDEAKAASRATAEDLSKLKEDISKDIDKLKETTQINLAKTKKSIEQTIDNGTKKITQESIAGQEKLEEVEFAKAKAKAASDETSQRIAKDLIDLEKAIKDRLDETKEKTKDLTDETAYGLKTKSQQVEGITEDVLDKAIREIADIKDTAENKINDLEDSSKSLAQQISEEITQKGQIAKDATKTTSDQLLESFDGFVSKADKKVTESKTSAKTIVDNLAVSQKKSDAMQSLTDVKEAVKESTADVINKAKTSSEEVSDDLYKRKQEALDSAKGAIFSASSSLGKAFESKVDESKKNVAHVGDKLGSKLDETKEGLKDTVEKIHEFKDDFHKEVDEKFSQIKQDTAQKTDQAKAAALGIVDDMNGLSQKVESKLSDQKDKTIKELGDLKEETGRVEQSVRSKIMDSQPHVVDGLTDLKETAKEKLDHTKDKTSQKITDMELEVDDKLEQALKAGKSLGIHVDKISTERIEDFNKAKDNLEEKAKSTVETTEVKVDEIKSEVSQKANKVKEGIVTTAGTFADDIAKKKDQVVEASKDRMDSVAKGVSDAKDQGGAKIEQTREEVKATAGEVSQSITVGFAGFEEALSTKLKESESKFAKLKDEISDSVSKKVDDVSASVQQDTSKVAGKVEDIKTATAEQIDRASTVVKDTSQTTVDKTSAVAQDIKTSVKDKAGDLKSGTKKAVDSVTSGIVGFGQSLGMKIDKVKKKTEDATDTITKVSSEAADTTKEKAVDVKVEIGTWAHGVAESVSQAKSDVEVAVKDASAKTTTTVDDLRGSVTEGVEEIRRGAEKVGDGLASKKQDIDDWVKVKADDTATEIEDLKHSTEHKIGDVKEAVTESTTQLTAKASNLKEELSKEFEQKRGTAETCAQGSVDKTAKEIDDIKQKGGKKLDDVEGGAEKIASETKGFFSKVGAEVKEVAGQVFGEVGSFEEDDQTPYVTTPTQARRAESQRYPTDQRPAVREMHSQQQSEQLSDEENYIVTEPGESPDRKRKPLFHIESEDDDAIVDAVRISGSRDSIKSNVLETLTETKIDNLLNNLVQDLADSTVEAKVEVKDSVAKVESELESIKKESEADVDEIEKKLRDLDKALDSLEQASDPQLEKKLHRVERKFERMASELEEEAVEVSPTEVASRRDTEFQRLVSQLSTEEVSDFQKEYSHLWDETTFSKTDDWDSKTPDSQIDVQELPQGEEAGTSTAPHNPSSTMRAEGEETASTTQTQSQRPVSDQHQLSDEMRQLLKDLERESKQ